MEHHAAGAAGLSGSAATLMSGEQLGKLRGTGWRDQIALESCFAGSSAARVLAAPGQRNQPHILQPRMLSQLPGYIVAAHIRQIEAQQNNRGYERHRNRESRLAGMGDPSVTVTGRLDQ